MAYLNDLSRGTLAKLERRLYKLEHKATLTNAAIGRDGMEVYDEGILNISNGTLIVNGYAQISGSLEVSGTSTFSGSTTIAGPTGITGALTVAGSMSITGPTTVAGTLDIEGDTTLTGNMDVLGGGKITVGNTILSPGAANGGVEFASGGGIGGNAGTVAMRGSANSGFLALSTEVASMFGGASFIDVKQADTTISSLLINLNAPQTSVNGKLVVTGTAKVTSDAELLGRVRVGNPYATGNAPNMYMDANGWIYRTS